MSRPATSDGRPASELQLNPEIRRNFSVVIPALNESESIPDLISELEATFREHELDGEVILVDDGSTDDSVEVAQREGKRLKRFKLERHSRNLGKTEALVSGTRAAETDWIILIDADLQHPPREIPRFLAQVGKGYDVVCGRKVGKYNKRLVSGAYNWLSRKIFHVPVRDLNAMKIFRKEVVQHIQLRHDWHRFFVVLAYARGYRIGEIDVPVEPRRKGASKYRGSGRVFIGFLDLLAVWFQLMFGRKPMLLFGFTGLTLFALGFLVGIGAIVLRLMGHGFRPLLDLVVLLGVVGISLFGFGFVAEMVATLRAELDDLREAVRGFEKRP